MFSKYLEKSKAKLEELVSLLSNDYEYVSILGVDSRSKKINTNKYSQIISNDFLNNECGFVLKINNKGSFFEYSFNNLDNLLDIKKEIDDLYKLNNNLKNKQIKISGVNETPLIKDFIRESDFDKYNNDDILLYSKKLCDDILTKDEKILNSFVVFLLQDISKIFVSKKRILTQNYTWVNGNILVIMSDGKRYVNPREGFYSNKIKDVMDKLPYKVTRLVNKGNHLLNATKIKPGYYDIITDPSITGLIAHEAFGHGLEMDQFVKDRAVAKYHMNENLATDIVNLKDGAASTFSVASYFFDDDGILAQDTDILKDGKLVGGICDLQSACELNYNPTGNGRRESYKNKSYTRMTNTFIDKGNSNLLDMISKIKHGYFLFETNNGMEDPKNWNIQCTAEYGIEIIDGKLTNNYVSPCVLSGNVIDLLKSIDMISNDFEIEGSGSCGKGYKEWVRVSTGGACLKCKCKLS